MKKLIDDFKRIVLEGPPIPLKRPKFVRRGPRSYAVNTQESEMLHDKAILRKQIESIEGPVSMHIFFYMPLPKSWSKKKQLEFKGKYCVCKPDLDNLIKYLLDVLTGIAFHGDQQVVAIIAEKQYSDDPRTEAILYSSPQWDSDE